jgi:membrane fusion protein (multidrug efflux system)
VHAGTQVLVTLRDSPPFEGKVTAVDSRIDAATRSIRLRATLRDRDAPLRSGMFVNVQAVLPAKQSVVVVPETAVVHAPFGDSVFVIDDKPPGSPGMTQTKDGKPVKLARQQFVRLGRTRGDFVSVTEGLTPGQQVVSFGAFKLRNGVPIVIDNRVQPKLELDPRPQER